MFLFFPSFKPCNVLRGNRCFVSSQTLVVYAPFAQRMNPERRSSLCIQMQSGWLLLVDGWRTDVSVGTCPVKCVGRRTRSTGPSSSIGCRLLPPQYRCPPSWSCRYCLCLVASMTGLVLSTSSRLALNCEASRLSFLRRCPHFFLEGVLTWRFCS